MLVSMKWDRKASVLVNYCLGFYIVYLIVFFLKPDDFMFYFAATVKHFVTWILCYINQDYYHYYY